MPSLAPNPTVAPAGGAIRPRNLALCHCGMALDLLGDNLAHWPPRSGPPSPLRIHPTLGNLYLPMGARTCAILAR